MNDHSISLETAKTMTATFRAQKENILAEAYQDSNILPRCETFDRDAVDTLLAQSGCAKLRIYYGMNESYQVHAIIVGVNADDEDMLPRSVEAKGSTASETADDNTIIETAIRCPETCPPSSDLNP